MMALVGAGGEKREGVRMGLWGAAQAFAFGIGGFLGTAGERCRALCCRRRAAAYAVVFASEARPVRGRGWHGGLRFIERRRPRTPAQAARTLRRPRLREGEIMTTARNIRRGGRRRRTGRAPPPRMISRGTDGRCCCSTAPDASSPAAAPFRRG